MKPTSYLRQAKIPCESGKLTIGWQLQQWWYSTNTQNYIGTLEKFDSDDPNNPNSIGEWRDIEKIE